MFDSRTTQCSGQFSPSCPLITPFSGENCFKQIDRPCRSHHAATAMGSASGGVAVRSVDTGCCCLYEHGIRPGGGEAVHFDMDGRIRISYHYFGGSDLLDESD